MTPFVREFRVAFERALAEKRRRVAFSAQETAMRLFVRDHLFFVFEHELAFVARESRLARFHVLVMLHLRRQHEVAIFARRRYRHVT